MNSPKVHRITAPLVLNAFAAMGIKSGEQYLSLDEDTLRRMMKGKGFTQHQKRYILRVGLRNKQRGWKVEFGEPSDGSLVPNFSPTAVSLRDYFAARAMEAHLFGYWADEARTFGEAEQCGISQNSKESIANEAYLMADAMMKARNRS